MRPYSFLTFLAVVLLLWGLITLVRRIAEDEEQRRSRGGRSVHEPPGRDEIDYEELRRAEDEVRDLGADARPEDGFEGDDWGPGAPRKPPLY